MQQPDSNTFFVWGVVRIGEGCDAHTTAVYPRTAWSVDNDQWFSSSIDHPHVGARQMDAHGHLAVVNCGNGSKWEFRSSVSVGLNNNGPGEFHRDADEPLFIYC